MRKFSSFYLIAVILHSSCAKDTFYGQEYDFTMPNNVQNQRGLVAPLQTRNRVNNPDTQDTRSVDSDDPNFYNNRNAFRSFVHDVRAGYSVLRSVITRVFFRTF